MSQAVLVDQACQKPSRVYTASADQMATKPAARAPPNGSPYSHTPSSSCNDGAMYCNKPSVDIGIRRAPAANNNSGTAVIGPAAATSHFDAVGACKKAFCPCHAIIAK